MNITVMGLGYIGSVTSACLSRNHSITGVDISKTKVDLINSGRSPIIEPGMDDLIKKAYESGRLRAVYDRDYVLDNTDAIIICVGTPSTVSGVVELTSLLNVTKFLSDLLRGIERKPAVIYRSTMPPGTMEEVIAPVYKNDFSRIDFPLVYHPEFLREGSAVKDFHENPQIVVAAVAGTDNIAVEKLFGEIYKDIQHRFYCVDVKSAEMIKYLNNVYHALKVAFSNEVARLCFAKGVNTHDLFKIFMEDEKLNISKAYLSPGFAYGGSCLPKDVRGMTALAQSLNLEIPLLRNIERSNEQHIEFAFQKILETGVSRIGFYGLSFKPETDDVRESPFIKLIEKLLGKGKEIKIFDASINLNSIVGKNLTYLTTHIPHISKRLVRNTGDLIDYSELIVLCHYNEDIVDMCKSKPSLIFLDLTGNLKGKYLSQNIRSLLLNCD